MTPSGISLIDDLLAGRTDTTIGPDSDADSIGAIQDLLLGHRFTRLPNPFGAGRGRFGPATTAAVQGFQGRNGLGATGFVDAATLQTMVAVPSTRPVCSRPYVTLVLDVPFTAIGRLMTLTTVFEGAGRFDVLNLNTDGAGLSYGLIQWAQKPGRLNELLIAFETAEPALFVEVFGGHDPAVSNGLIAHTARPRGGTTDAGTTLDPAFDLTLEPWTTRFGDAALRREFQRVQFATALADFTQSCSRINREAPQVGSERGIGFLLDVANQHGDGGLKSILDAVSTATQSEADLLAAVEQESVGRVRAKFGEGAILESTKQRRHAFLTTPLLGGDPLMMT